MATVSIVKAAYSAVLPPSLMTFFKRDSYLNPTNEWDSRFAHFQSWTWSVGSTTGTLKIGPRSMESSFFTSHVLSILKSLPTFQLIFDKYEIHSRPFSYSTCVGVSLAPKHFLWWPTLSPVKALLPPVERSPNWHRAEEEIRPMGTKEEEPRVYTT